jgi:hypothetical protein
MVAIGTENIPPWANIEKKQELVYFAQKIQKISHKIQDHKMKLAQKIMVPSTLYSTKPWYIRVHLRWCGRTPNVQIL